MTRIPALLASIVAASALSLAGCATEPELGDSVRHMVEGQKYNPQAPQPGTQGFDGQAAAKAVDAYRSGTRPAAKTPTPTILLPSSP